MFGRNSFAALPRGNATALQEKTAQQKKSGEILCHLCLEDPFLLRTVHDDYSFCTRSAPQFYERTTSAERVMNVGTTRDELGEHKEKRWYETGSDEELKREGEVYI